MSNTPLTDKIKFILHKWFWSNWFAVISGAAILLTLAIAQFYFGKG